MIKRKALIILLGVIAVFACFAAGCSSGFDPSKDISKDFHKVYLDYNGGKSTANESLKGATVYVRDGKKIDYEGLQNIENKNLIPTYYGYILDGFACGERKEDGTVEFEKTAGGDIKFWDFDNNTVTEELTLFAVWSQAYTINLITPDGTVNVSYIVSESSPYLNSITTKRVSGYTVINFEVYSDEARENLIEFPYKHPGIGSETDERVANLYLNWIEGEYSIVRTDTEFRTAIQNGNAIYLWNDIDFKGVQIGVAANYNKEINGNGHTVENFKKANTVAGVSAVNLGLFAIIGANANIYDITFKNVTIEQTCNGNPSQFNAGIFAGQITEGAKFDNVTLENVSITYKVRDGYIENNPEKVKIGNICGNEKSDANADGITVTGVELVNCSLQKTI